MVIKLTRNVSIGGPNEGVKFVQRRICPEGTEGTNFSNRSGGSET